MTKVSGSYASIVRGVSQQVPETRLDGQQGEQVNFLSDPVNGLARRRGTRNLLEAVINTVPSQTHIEDLSAFIARDFSILAIDYVLLYRKTEKPLGSTAPYLLCYNKTANVMVPLVFSLADVPLNYIVRGGISAVTQIGRYTVMAGNSYTVPGREVPMWDTVGNSSLTAFWVRGGAYNRTFRITITTPSGTAVLSYTTPSAGYPGILDTSDILTSDPDYQKKVNDRVNAYDSAVTAWITTAANAASPAGIAEGLYNDFITHGGNPGLLSRIGNYLFTTPPYLGITNVTVDDSGDGSLIRVVNQVVKDASELTGKHYPGKIVKVQAKEGAPAYYLRAKATGAVVAPGISDVRWEEAAGSEYETGAVCAILTIENGTLYAASSPVILQSLIPSIVVPQGVPRKAGDGESNKPPFFIGRTIEYLGTYQDRLVIGSGAVLFMSEVGNYFNFFRTSVLTVIDSDPVEVYALGSEDDIIRHSVIFDKSLLLFGDQQQYSINGRVPVTPATSSVIQSSAHEDTTLVRPLASGDLVFYVKEREGYTQAYQLNIGDVADTSNSTEVTQQLSTYIPGTPVEFITTTTPNMVLLRTTTSGSRLYTYRYLDTSGGRERLLDSWSTWEFSPLCGTLVGLSTDKGQPLLFFLRSGEDAAGIPRLWLSVDRASLLANVDNTPYLDSQRPYTTVRGGLTQRSWHTQAGLSTAYNKTAPGFLQGTPKLSDVPVLLAAFPESPVGALVTGADFTAYVVPTNPFTRDRNEKTISMGHLTVTHFDVAYRDTAGLTAEVTTAYSSNVVMSFNGYAVGAPAAPLGKQPIGRGVVRSYVGKETREYELALRAKTWLPVTMTSFEWTGQYFYNTKRT